MRFPYFSVATIFSSALTLQLPVNWGPTAGSPLAHYYNRLGGFLDGSIPRIGVMMDRLWATTTIDVFRSLYSLDSLRSCP